MSKLDLLQIDANDKLTAVQEAANYFVAKGFKIIQMDLQRPWGFYFYFDTEQTSKFTDAFFSDVELEGIDTSLPLQPKVLVFEPGKMASWQYHHRRSEIWRCITKTCHYVISDTDKLASGKQIGFGDVVNFVQGKRHRGGSGDDQWAAVAEIWQHTDSNNPSDEDDIVRVQDDFGRS
jgi:mannose-6-phosphate isomerase